MAQTNMLNFVLPGFRHLNNPFKDNFGVPAFPEDYDKRHSRMIVSPITGGEAILTAHGSMPYNLARGIVSPNQRMHYILTFTGDWIYHQHDGIKGYIPNNPNDPYTGLEIRSALINGDRNGIVMFPKRVDLDNVVYTMTTNQDPWPGTYQFCYKQQWTANRYYKNADCSDGGMIPRQWSPMQMLRVPYTALFGGNIGRRRVVEYWSGNDVLWEIFAFAEGVGLVAYRQWWLQAGNGRTVVWTEDYYPGYLELDCCFLGTVNL